MTITQKIEQKYFDHIVAGEKREVRLTTDLVHEGDTVILEEWDPHAQEYTGRKLETVVTTVHSITTTADWAAPEHDGKQLQLIQFERKESKYTPAS